MKPFFITLITIMALSCSVKLHINNESICNNNEEISIGFRNPPRNSTDYKRLIQDSLKPEITIFFESGFKDSLLIYFNNKLFLCDYFLSNGNIRYITYNYSDWCDGDVLLKIQEVHNNYCIETKIVKNYRILGVSRFNNKWWLNYSNYVLLYE